MKFLKIALLAGFCLTGYVNSQDLEAVSEDSLRNDVGLSAVLEIHKLQAQGQLPNFSKKDRIAVSVPMGSIDRPQGRADAKEEGFLRTPEEV